MPESQIAWNAQVKLIISDVDETVADLYCDAEPAMIGELERLLADGKAVFFISGQSIRGIEKRIVDHVAPRFRKSILVGHCSGAEVWAYDERGGRDPVPLYSLYSRLMSRDQQVRWRVAVEQLIAEFGFRVHPTMPIAEFKETAGEDPLAIMFDDRGPQITLELANAHALGPDLAQELARTLPIPAGVTDLRGPVSKRAQELFAAFDVPVTAREGGMFALDFALAGVSKANAVRFVLEQKEVLPRLGLGKLAPKNIEVWGDKFSTVRGGTDRHILEALPRQVRAITFRREDPNEFPPDCNIVIWNGNKQLHEGLLEYLMARGTVA